MKKHNKLPHSYDDLIHNAYGKPGRYGEGTLRPMEHLLANYYGAPLHPKQHQHHHSTNGKAVAMTLSCDDGEVLTQQKQLPQPNGLARQYSVSNEEYVVSGKRGRAVSISFSAHEGGVVQEYQLDVLQPTGSTQPATGETGQPTAEAPTNGSGQVQSSPAAARPAAAPPASANAPAPASQPDAASSEGDSNAAQPSEDDFVADLQAILTGQKVYDPNTGKTTDRAQQGRTQPGQTVPIPGTATPVGGDDTPRGGPDSGSGQDIFDRIAKSMSYANAYDLGDIELENRFAEFDKDYEADQAAKKIKPVSEARQAPAGPGAPAASAPAAARTGKPQAKEDTGSTEVGAADFIQDLDAIRGGYGRSAASPTPGRAAPDSLSQDYSHPQSYSRPFYDTGEHVIEGGGEYEGMLHLGPPPGVAFSYGEIIAMGDLFSTADDMINASPAELHRLKDLIDRSVSYYQGGKRDDSLDVSNKQWQDATNKRFLKLAEDNYEHFSPPAFFKYASGSSISHGTNQSAWQHYHQLAIQAAQEQFTRGVANTNQFFERALIINAFGDHFLTDAFAAGHLLNKDAMIADFKRNFLSGGNLTSAGEKFFETVAGYSWFTDPDVRSRFSDLETVDYPVCVWGWCLKWHPNIDTPYMFAKVLKGAAEEQPDAVGNLVVKALHDRLNKEGVQVINDAGDKPWLLKGDGHLQESQSLPIIIKAVQQSIDNINDRAIQASNLNYQPFFNKVWKYVPRPPESEQRRVSKLISDYTRPDSEDLMRAAAKLIHTELESFVDKLIDEKKLKPA